MPPKHPTYGGLTLTKAQKKERNYNIHWQAIPKDKKGASLMPVVLRDLAPNSKFSPSDLWQQTKVKATEDKMAEHEAKIRLAEEEKEALKAKKKGGGKKDKAKGGKKVVVSEEEKITCGMITAVPIRSVLKTVSVAKQTKNDRKNAGQMTRKGWKTSKLVTIWTTC
jgi:hypothetical protein